jgi:hypothetical protein
MKKLPSKFRTSVIVYFAGVASFLSNAMWNSSEFFEPSFGQTKYWVLSPDTSYSVESSSTIFSTVVKWIEIVLIGVIFLIWIISYFKIRKIDDKELKSVKIKHTIFTVIILLLLVVLVRLWNRFYVMYFW